MKQNFQMREIAEASFQYQQEVKSQQRKVVGVNAYKVDEHTEIPTLKIDPQLEAQQVARVAKLRADRDADRANTSLAALTAAAAAGDQNLMYPILECARARCTVGEIVTAMREVFGSWTETPTSRRFHRRSRLCRFSVWEQRFA